jgi:phytoene dehydrogenase-like protein
VPDKYYDVIVIGRSLGALSAAAILARRDFTVLVVGQGQLGADYQCEGRTLRRRVFTMLAATSPVWRRMLGELAKTQTWKRRIQSVAPMLQVILSGWRFEVPPDAELFNREVERQFPDARRRVADLYRDFARVTAAADAGFERDAVWPPGTFMERRQTGRIAATLPYARAEPHADLMAEFPRTHPYRRIVADSVRFVTDLATPTPAFAQARLHGAWTRGLVALAGGERELDDVLIERIEQNGGVYMNNERVATIEVKRGAVSGVQLDGDARATGAGFVITDMTGEEIAALAGGQGISKRARSGWPRIIPSTRRFVVSLMARREGVPEPLGQEVFVFSDAPQHGYGHTIHLQRSAAENGEVLLTAEVLRGERDKLPLTDARAWVVRRLCKELPFLERHLAIVDSVHDGLPAWRYDSDGTQAVHPVEIERTEIIGAAARAEPMDRQLEVDPPGYLGLGGEPVRGPIENTLLVGPSVLPGLGQEGKLLAAWSAARLVTQSDKRKARMRRGMWTKMEIS